ncbi:MAG: hypothetical protein JSS64_02575 [Bacteroidetes bacterium]|nr:hypothetical protein [Bacteroidota bacterium]
MAQTLDVQKEVERIDTLMDKYFVNFDQAETAANHLWAPLKTKINNTLYYTVSVLC